MQCRQEPVPEEDETGGRSESVAHLRDRLQSAVQSVVLGETHLRRIVRHYVNYYHRARTHLALDKDAPEPRSVQPPERGRVIEIPEVGGLHHRYERRAA